MGLLAVLAFLLCTGLCAEVPVPGLIVVRVNVLGEMEGAYVPFSDFRFYLPRMQRAPESKRSHEFCRAHPKLLDEVYRRIVKEGPLGSGDFEHKAEERGPWWDWKPAKQALEMLLDQGKLMVTARDNLVIDRDRLLRLFDFDYKIECYTPAAKRRYGYFTLPILWKGRLVGRLDPKAERKKKQFMVRNVVLERSFNQAKAQALAPLLAKALHEFAGFNGCEEVQVEQTNPKSFKAALQRAL